VSRTTLEGTRPKRIRGGAGISSSSVMTNPEKALKGAIVTLICIFLKGETFSGCGSMCHGKRAQQPHQGGSPFPPKTMTTEQRRHIYL